MSAKPRTRPRDLVLPVPLARWPGAKARGQPPSVPAVRIPPDFSAISRTCWRCTQSRANPSPPNSLLCCLGNLAKKDRELSRLDHVNRRIAGYICENSLFFPCLTGNLGETGSLETPCTASKSLISQKNRAGFELPVRFAAVRGPWRRAAARAGPRERGLSALSAASQTFSLLANFEVRFSRAIPRLACVTGHELPLPTGSRAPGC